jgi:membrane-bound lytic murein transglycosylase F
MKRRGTWIAFCAVVLAGCSHDRRTDAAHADSSFVKRDTGVVTVAPDAQRGAPRDWDAIVADDTLRVLAPFNSTTYFIYRGEPMGYEYELVKAFAAAHHLVVKMSVIEDRDSLLAMLQRGRADVVIARLVPMPQDSGKVSFTIPLYHTDPVLVQRKAPPAVAAAKLPHPADTVLRPGPAERGAPVGSAKALTIHARLVQRPSDLTGQKVTLPAQSPYRQTLIELADTTGDIDVVEVDSSSEALIRAVAQGNENYTVTDDNLARLQGSYFRNLLIHPVMGESKPVAWAVNRRAPTLRDTLNAWLGDERNHGVLDRMYRKYFVDQRGYTTRVTSRYLTSRTGVLSPYDDLLRRAAAQIGWDWRLLGSQMYQESQFKPAARSWAGALGLLQVMPATARQFGVRDPLDPQQNVTAAVKYLQWLEAHWAKAIEDPAERLKFVLASYNAGTGHIEDAQRLASANGADPNKWNDVSYWVLQLSKAEAYTQPEVKFGFCRGLEPVLYVSAILDRFQNYKQFVTGDTTAAPAASGARTGR